MHIEEIFWHWWLAVSLFCCNKAIDWLAVEETKKKKKNWTKYIYRGNCLWFHNNVSLLGIAATVHLHFFFFGTYYLNYGYICWISKE